MNQVERNACKIQNSDSPVYLSVKSIGSFYFQMDLPSRGGLMLDSLFRQTCPQYSC